MCKRVIVAVVVSCGLALPTLGQDSQSGGYDLFAPLNIQDATPLATGQLDLRLRYDYSTGGDNSGDDQTFGTTFVWGASNNLELRLDLPVIIDDGSGSDEGFGDLSIGILYRLADDRGAWLPAVALSGTVWAPTGEDSSGVDGELRLIFTKEYDSDLRSHVNGFVTTVNGHDDDLRNFQWGIVLGMDGVLCAEGKVRWVADYMHRSSERNGSGDMNVLELGAEWTVTDTCRLGLSTQFGLDDEPDSADWGMSINAIYALKY